MSADKLPQGKWTFRLETYEGFPFEFEKNNASICFEAKEEQSAVLYYSQEIPAYPAASLSCCFVTSEEIRSKDSTMVKVDRVVLAASKTKVARDAVHFEIQEPQGIFKDFYCSSIIDDYDALSARKTHLPSLGDMSNLLSVGFRLNPDPI